MEGDAVTCKHRRTLKRGSEVERKESAATTAAVEIEIFSEVHI
jgi:uncharacterized protein (DUF1786 family)